MKNVRITTTAYHSAARAVWSCLRVWGRVFVCASHEWMSLYHCGVNGIARDSRQAGKLTAVLKYIWSNGKHFLCPIGFYFYCSYVCTFTVRGSTFQVGQNIHPTSGIGREKSLIVHGTIEQRQSCVPENAVSYLMRFDGHSLSCWLPLAPLQNSRLSNERERFWEALVLQ